MIDCTTQMFMALSNTYIMKKFVLVFILSISFIASSFAQNVGITNDGSLPHASAMLDVKHPNKGMLVPRVALTSTTDVATIPSPAVSLLVYNTATAGGVTPGYYYWSGTAWLMLSTGSGAASGATWLLTGNAGTVDGTNFIGTTDNVPFNIRVNNQKAGRIDPTLENTFLGYQAGNLNTTGRYNTANGFEALYSNTASSNTATGYKALFSNTIGNSNTANGASALASNTTGAFNTANGLQALASNTTGISNTANGLQALLSNTTGAFNTANGVLALASNTTGQQNTANGLSALASNTTGSNNTANGVRALASNTTGSNNTASGVQALRSNTTGDFNTGTGNEALYFNTTGVFNTGTGNEALQSNTTGFENTATGNRALQFNTNGFGNTANGSQALFKNIGGSYNTAIGQNSLQINQSGNFNTAVGTEALSRLNGGSRNIAIGAASGTDPGSPGVTNTISIGNDGILNAASNQTFLGNLSTLWNGGNKPWSTYSDARMKNNIKEDVKGLDFITRLKPVTYYRSINAVTKIINRSSPATQASHFAGQAGEPIIEEYAGKYDVEKIKETGFLAQDVEQAAKAAGFDFSGITIPGNSNQLYTLSYEVFVVPLVKAVQEQQVMIDQQKRDNEALKAQVAELTKAVKALLK